MNNYKHTNKSLPWTEIDTVLLDMDGTLLDLHYDNQLWNIELPKRYAKLHNVTLAAAETRLFDYMASVRGTINFYCLDHWQEFTGIDMRELHLACAELITYRPGAKEFLDWLRIENKHSVLVTNAHRLSLNVKNQFVDLSAELNQSISCHDFSYPKEDQKFWRAFADKHPFNKKRTVFIDDNADVLAAAAAFGIGHLISITQPDSARPPRTDLDYPAVNDLRELL